MIYTYFVSYSHEQGFGCMELFCERRIKNFSDIQETKKNIEDKTKLRKVVIINYILLNKKIGKLDWEE